MAQNAEAVCNIALVALGENKITTLDTDDGSYESEEAAACATLYPQAKLELLEAADWPFAREASLLSKQTAAPDTGFTAKFTLPADCVKPQEVVDGTLYTHSPVTWRRYGNEIHADRDSVTLHYTKDVEVGLWPTYFVQAVAMELARQLALSFNKTSTDIDRFELRAEKTRMHAMQRGVTEEPAQSLPTYDMRRDPFGTLMRGWSS
jgi:hypothetical protein